MTVYRLRREVYIAVLRWWGRIARYLPRQGIGLMATTLGFMVPEGDMTDVEAGHGQMRLPTSDRYYAGLIARSRKYEPEIENLLRRSLPFLRGFIDGGANFGYWSVFMSTSPMYNVTVIAVEANPANFDVLEQNCRLNGRTYTPMLAALSDTDGDSAFIHAEGNAKHAIGRVLLSSEAGGCPTVTVDSILRMHSILAESCLIKLDIEGFEQRALLGATESIRRGAVVIYEDHGQDRQCMATTGALQAGLAVHLIEEHGLHSIQSAESLVRRKVSRTRGYNCLAARKDSILLHEILSSVTTGS